MRDAVSGALEDDGCAADVEGLVFEEVPGNSAGSMGACLGYARRMSRYQEDCENAGPGCKGGPYLQRGTKVIVIEKDS